MSSVSKEIGRNADEEEGDEVENSEENLTGEKEHLTGEEIQNNRNSPVSKSVSGKTSPASESNAARARVYVDKCSSKRG